MKRVGAVLLLALLALGGAAQDLAAQTQRGGTARGRVLDAGTGRPVPGAEVSLGGGPTAVSNGTGEFRIAVPAAGAVLVVRHVAYAERSVAAGPDAVLTVRLTPRPVSLDALVVTASRRTQSLKNVPVATEVIDRATLRQTGASDVASILVEQTGIAAEGGHPVGSGVMLQGLGSERVLVLLDGQPWIGRVSGRQDLSRIPSSMVERVEIVKGPQSTLYGSEAMGGVVNVITRAPLTGSWSGGVDVTGGSRGRLDVGGNLRGGGDGLGLSADVGRRTVELVPGLDEVAGTYATRWDGMGRLHWDATPTLGVTTSGFLLDERQRWRSGQIYQFADNMQWGARAGAVWRDGRHTLSPTVHASEFRHHSRSGTRASPVDGSGDREVQRLVEAELLYALDLGDIAIDAGVEASREAIRSDRVAGTDRTMHAAEPFAQATWTRGPVTIVPGARLSWSEQWGTSFTPRIAALYRPVERLALRASVGAGYRAPDFKELYMEFLNVGPGFGYVVRGNGDLQPEHSRNVSGSIEWAGDRVYARVQAFHNDFDDFIETREAGDSSGVTVFTYGNIDDGVTRGVELETGATWGPLRAEAGWSWLRAERAGSGESLLGRPARSGRASLAWTTPVGFRASATALHTGLTPLRREEGALIERDAFTRLDVRFAQSIPAGFELNLGIDNVTDVSPGEWPGYLGRQIHLGVSWRGGREGSPLDSDLRQE